MKFWRSKSSSEKLKCTKKKMSDAIVGVSLENFSVILMTEYDQRWAWNACWRMHVQVLKIKSLHI